MYAQSSVSHTQVSSVVSFLHPEFNTKSFMTVPPPHLALYVALIKFEKQSAYVSNGERNMTW
jgi:hypothetical protein